MNAFMEELRSAPGSRPRHGSRFPSEHSLNVPCPKRKERRSKGYFMLRPHSVISSMVLRMEEFTVKFSTTHISRDTSGNVTISTYETR